MWAKESISNHIDKITVTQFGYNFFKNEFCKVKNRKADKLFSGSFNPNYFWYQIHLMLTKNIYNGLHIVTGTSG